MAEEGALGVAMAEGFRAGGVSELEEESESEVSADLASGFFELPAEAETEALGFDDRAGGATLTGVLLGGGLSALESESEEELWAFFLDRGLVFVFTAAFAELGLGLAGRDLAAGDFLGGG